MNRSAYFVHVIVLILATCTFGCSSNSAKVHEHDIPMLEVHTGEIVRHADINIEDVWARPGFIGGNSAIYISLSNIGDYAEYLIGAEYEICTTVEIHQIRMQGDIMTMRPISEDIEILPGQTVSFEPDDLHFMMINLGSDLTPGSHLQIQCS